MFLILVELCTQNSSEQKKEYFYKDLQCCWEDVYYKHHEHPLILL
jgi:hypothetical protein